MLDVIKLGVLKQTKKSQENSLLPIRKYLDSVRIGGNDFYSLIIPAKSSMPLTSLYSENKTRTLIFYTGTCSMEYDGIRHVVDEVAVFTQDQKKEVVIHADNEDVQVLELIMSMNEEDKKELDRTKSLANKFYRYSESNPYSEGIKSAKTVSRTLLPEKIVPRLSIGSVFAEGEDSVAAHKHPMLEQCFLGLEENNSKIIIEEEKYLFPPLSLVYIPLGKMHGVSVDKGDTMHYLWIDMFHTLEGMSYLEEQHIPIGQNSE